MQISIKADVKEFSRWMNATQKKALPSAIRNGLNATAFQTMKGMRKDLPKFVKNPTKFTERGLQYSRAEKTNLTARVGFVSSGFGKPVAGSKTMPADYMARLSTGGIRLPNRKSIPVPVIKNYKTNKFGNIKRNDINKFLNNDKKYFVGIPKGMTGQKADGIWKRMGRGGRKNIAMVIAWEPSTKYNKSYPFGQQVRDHVRKRFRKEFEKYIIEVMDRKGIAYFSKYKLGNIL